MPPKIKVNQLAGYENTAFNYRYLNTTLTPLSIMEAVVGIKDNNTLGRRVWNMFGGLFGELSYSSPKMCLSWLSHLSAFGCDYDRTYRLLADEYYRQKDNEA